MGTFMGGFVIGIFIFCLLVILYTGFFFLCGGGAFGKWGQLVPAHNYKYNKKADKLVEYLLDKLAAGELNAELGSHELTIGDYKIWIENKFYAYCCNIFCRSERRTVYSGVRISYKQAMRVYRLEQYLIKNGPVLNTKET